jgi:PEP-CTERM motif
MILIKGSAGLGAAMLIGLSALSAQAGYVVDLTQQGSNVVATGSGPIDLTGLTFDTSPLAGTFIFPALGAIATGITATADLYAGITGPANFGSGSDNFPISGSGDHVGVDGFVDELEVPHGYVSDSPLSDTSTYLSQTFSSLGATPGTYTWTWGTGANQNFTLVIGAAAVPEPSTWAMMLLGFAGLGFMGYQSAGRRRRTAGNA